MHRVALVGQMERAFLEPLQEAAGPQFSFEAYPSAVIPEAAAAEIEVLIASRFNRDFPPLPALRLVQVPLSGTDLIDRSAVPRGVPVCNVSGHGRPVAEYVILGALAQRRRWRESTENFRAGDWSLSSRTNGPLLGDLSGSKCGIIGFGEIGRAVAALASAMGMDVRVCNRSPIADPAVAYVPWDRLEDLCSWAEFVVVACAHTPATDRLVDARLLAAMDERAVLINVSRGELVDQAALFDACSKGRIGGAVIDTWYNYPKPGETSVRPADYPFWELDCVLMSPHNSAWTHGTFTTRVRQMADNLGWLTAGEPLARIVHLEPAPGASTPTSPQHGEVHAQDV